MQSGPHQCSPSSGVKYGWLIDCGVKLVQGFGVWDGNDDGDFLGPVKGQGKGQGKEPDDKSDDMESLDALDSAVQEWEKLSKMRNTARG